MKEKNTIGELKYYLYNIGISLVIFYIYYSSFYRTLDGFTRKESSTIFCLLYVFLLVFGIMINAENRRNKLSIAVNNIIPIEVITACFYYKELKYFVWILLCLSLILSSKYILYVAKRKIKVCTPKIKRKIILRRIKACFLYSRTVTAFDFSIILVGLIFINIIIPIFVPHEGCPHDCAFCNQRTISGKNAAPDIKEARNIIETYLELSSIVYY